MDKFLSARPAQRSARSALGPLSARPSQRSALSALGPLNRSVCRVAKIACSVGALIMLLVLSSVVALAQSQSTETLFFDDLNNGFNSSTWDQYGKNGLGNFILGRTIWNPATPPSGTVIIDRYQAPATIRSFSTLKLSTYATGNAGSGNPRSDGNGYRRNFTYGTEFQTKQEFAPPALGQAIDFEACVDLSNLPSGAVAAMYPYGQDVSGQIITSDEIDFEYLGKFSPNSFLATAWNNFQRNYVTGKAVDETSYNNQNGQNRHFGLERPLLKGQFPGIPLLRNDPGDFHCIKIRWLHTTSGFSVEWYTRGSEDEPFLLVHQERNVKPDRAMRLHFNIWVPESDFQPAFDESLFPAEFAESNRDYYMYVDYVKVTRVSNVQENGLPRTSPSTPVASPPAGTALGNPSSVEPFRFNVSLTPDEPDTNTRLRATPILDQAKQYDFTYRFSVNGYVVQYGSNRVFNLATPRFGDHGDVVTVTVFARSKTTDDNGYATANITVVNTAPVADSVTANAQSGQEVIIPLTASDIDRDTLTFNRVGNVANGTANAFLDTDGQYKMRYTSRAGFNGIETVRFKARDDFGGVSDIATITINVGSGGSS